MTAMTTQNKLSIIRQNIAGIEADIATVEAQRKSRDQIAVEVDAAVDYWSKEADAIIRRNMARAAAGFPTEFLTAHIAGKSLDLGPLFVLLVGSETVRDSIAKALPTVPEGLPTAERQNRLTDLRRELRAACYHEEIAIREAEAAGEIIAYRSDADPAVVLAWRPEQ